MHGLAGRPEGTDLARLYYFNGTFAYLITGNAARFLLQHLFPLQAHIDHQMSRVLIEQRQVFSAYYVEPPFFEPDWSQRSDCYVPLADDTSADRELGQLFEATRQTLLGAEASSPTRQALGRHFSWGIALHASAPPLLTSSPFGAAVRRQAC